MYLLKTAKADFDIVKNGVFSTLSFYQELLGLTNSGDPDTMAGMKGVGGGGGGPGGGGGVAPMGGEGDGGGLNPFSCYTPRGSSMLQHTASMADQFTLSQVRPPATVS